MRSTMRFQTLAAVTTALSLAACRGANGVGAPSTLPAAGLAPAPAGIAQLLPDGSHGKIQHIVIVVQENRSFNNLFYNYPGAKTATYGYDSNRQKVELRPVDLAINWDLEHASDGFLKACDGTGKIPGTDCRMDGFDREIKGCGGSGQPHCPIQYPEYSYVPQSQVKPYWDMAHQYVLADEMFASNFDASSFVSHQYIIAGAANSSVDYPDNLWGCPGGPGDMIGIVNKQRSPIPSGHEVVCWNRATLGDELDKKKLPWAFYAPPLSAGDGIWSSYQTIKHIYKGPDWKNDVFYPPSQFLTDIGNGKLRTVTWITPTYVNSDHPGSGSNTGPSWVASLVNAIGESKYWNSSAIFIFWDDYGGFFDAEKPAYLDYDGLGIRLPLLIVSPYAKKGHVSRVHYEHGSILRFAEDQFGLARLAASDKRATSPASDCFDFSQPPRKFVKIDAPYDRAFFMRQPVDHRPPDTQ
jgi:phospholipase C